MLAAHFFVQLQKLIFHLFINIFILTFIFYQNCEMNLKKIKDSISQLPVYYLQSLKLLMACNKLL